MTDLADLPGLERTSLTGTRGVLVEDASSAWCEAQEMVDRGEWQPPILPTDET